MRTIILLFLCASVVALLIAPVLMPASYDWIAHTTSESGAQGIDGAWLVRTGFVLYGVAVLLLAASKKDWNRLARWIHAIFGLSMIGNAVFSSKPWLTELPFDALEDTLEDTLHSWMSGLVGTAFTVGVLVAFFLRGKSGWFSKPFDSVAILTSIIITVIMFSGDEGFTGLIQRIMFAVSYLWYAKEGYAKEAPPTGWATASNLRNSH